MDNIKTSSEEIEDIDFSKVDWNNLGHDEFHKLSNKMLARQKLQKKTTKSLGSKVKFVTVELRNKKYFISESLMIRIRDCKNAATKTKLIDGVISTTPTLEEL